MERHPSDASDVPSVLDDSIHATTQRRVQELQRELDELLAREDPILEIAFSGAGVYNNAITFMRLTSVAESIGQTMRWTAHDLAIYDGDEVPPGRIDALAEPVLAGTFAGSFGLAIGRAPVEEQASLLVPSLFERTADKVVHVFRTARDTRDLPQVLRACDGLRSRAIAGFRKLGQAMTLSEDPTLIRWRNDELVAVTMPVASIVVEALSFTRDMEYDIPVVGTLEGGDLPDERFHIRTVEDGRRTDYRGNVDTALLPMLRGLTFGARVRATLSVTELDSEYMARPRRTYVLTAITVLEGDVLNG
jgi:hypothetical protein